MICYYSNAPPIGLSVYDTYGRSESEQTLIGGETGLEFEHDSPFGEDKRRSLTATVLPRIKRLAFKSFCRFC